MFKVTQHHAPTGVQLDEFFPLHKYAEALRFYGELVIIRDDMMPTLDVRMYIYVEGAGLWHDMTHTLRAAEYA